VHPDGKAIAEKFRRLAFRPYDEVSGRRIEYGDGHPFEQRKRALGTARQPSDTIGSDMFDMDVIEYALDHEPLRIHFVTDALDAALGQSVDKDRQIGVIKEIVLPGIAGQWSRALSVVPVKGFIPVQEDACYGLANLGSDTEVTGADMVIIVDVASREELACVPGGNNALAVAAPCEVDQWDRPVIGFMNFCLEKDARATTRRASDSNEEILELISIGTHEAGHCLGMVSELIKFFRNPKTGEPLTPRPFKEEWVSCVDGARRKELRPSTTVLAEGMTSRGAPYYELITPRLATVVKNQFNCNSLKGARLENQPTSQSCFGSHLDERLFFTELMGPVYSDFSNALSPVTMAYFEDSSWYVANYSASTPSTFGHGAGCDFVNEDCIVDGQVPEYSKGFFCNHKVEIDQESNTLLIEGITCDPTRTHMAVCDLAARDEIEGLPYTEVPGAFQYFPEDPDLGAWSMWLADFCPIATISWQDSGMDCQDATTVRSGEYFGADSRCYDVWFDTTRGKAQQSMCLKTICNAERNVVEFEAGSSRVVCDFDGQVHTLSGVSSPAELECPRFAVVCPELICPGNCAGRGVCNWNSEGGPKCECFDKTDSTLGCVGSFRAGFQRSEQPTSMPKSSPSPTLIPSTQPFDTPNPSPTFEIPYDLVLTKKPTDKRPYDGPIIKLGPDTSPARSFSSSIVISATGTFLLAFELVLAMLS